MRRSDGRVLLQDDQAIQRPDTIFEQFGVQLLAASVAAVFAFSVTFLLVKVIDSTWGFCLEPQEENEGLDRTQHGEVGFDVGTAYEQVPETPPTEPRPAMVPPNGKGRFTVVLEGTDPHELMQAWSRCARPGQSNRRPNCAPSTLSSPPSRAIASTSAAAIQPTERLAQAPVSRRVALQEAPLARVES